MKFSTTFKTFAFPVSLVDSLPTLVEQYGEEAQDALLTVKTLACGWDDSDHTRLRALRFPSTVSLTDLKDGRKAYTALWSLSLLDAIDRGDIADIAELTQQELNDLIFVEEPGYLQDTITE